MSYSLNEVQATAKKAVRGVGYPWGIAEEAAKSARWLCHHNLDGCAVLARYLEKIDSDNNRGNSVSRSPVIYGRLWSGVDGSLCPLLSGVALSDRAEMFDGKGIKLQQVSEPALLLFFATLMARRLEATARATAGCRGKFVRVAWQGCRFATDGNRVSVIGTPGEHTDELIIEFAESLEQPQVHNHRASPATGAWESLNRFAQRTYAPATEESRLMGAGAGLSDND